MYLNKLEMKEDLMKLYLAASLALLGSFISKK